MGQEPAGGAGTDYAGWTWQQIKQAIVGGGADPSTPGGGSDTGLSDPRSFLSAADAFDEAKTELTEVHDNMQQWMRSVFGENGSYQGAAADTLEGVLNRFSNLLTELSAPLPAYRPALETAETALEKAIGDINRIDSAAAAVVMTNWTKNTVMPGVPQTPPPVTTGANGGAVVDVSTDPAVTAQLNEEMRGVITTLAGAYRQAQSRLRPPTADTRTGTTQDGATQTGDAPGTGPDAANPQNRAFVATPAGPSTVDTPGTSAPAITAPALQTGTAPGGSASLPGAPATTAPSVVPPDVPAAAPSDGGGLNTGGGFLMAPTPHVDLISRPNGFGSNRPADPKDPATRLARYTPPVLDTPELTPPELTAPHLTAAGLTNPNLTNPNPTTPNLTTPNLTAPELSSGRPSPGTPGAGLPAMPPMLPLSGMGAFGRFSGDRPGKSRLIDVPLDRIRPSEIGLGDVKVTDVHSGGPELKLGGPQLERLTLPPEPGSRPFGPGENVLLGSPQPAAAIATNSAVSGTPTPFSPGAVAGEAETAGNAGMSPMFLGAGAGMGGHDEEERRRESWLLECEDVWSGNRPARNGR